MTTQMLPVPASPPAPGQIRITLDDPLGQIPADYWIWVDPASTPADVEVHLVDAGTLNGRGPQGERLTYGWPATAGRSFRDEPLGDQGVTEGAWITVNTKNIQGAGRNAAEV